MSNLQAEVLARREHFNNSNANLYQKFSVKFKFRDRVYGGLPKSENLVESYVKAKFDSEDTSVVETELDLVKELEKSRTGFKRHDDFGVYLGDYQIKAMIKQCASLLKLTVQKRGTKQTVAETLFVKGLTEDGELVEGRVPFIAKREKPDGIEGFQGCVKDQAGTRSAVKEMEFVERADVNLQLWVLGRRIGGKQLSDDDLLDILLLGQEVGLGSGRAFEKGKFDLLEFDQLQSDKE